MKTTHLGVQAVIVLGLVALISWPQFRPLRAQGVWRYSPASRSPQAEDFSRVSRLGNAKPDARLEHGAADAQSQRAEPASAPSPTADETTPAYVAPLSVAAVGAKFNALVGSALTSLNQPIPFARLALRNIRTAHVDATATANDEGSFSFLDLDSGAYVVELLGVDGSVIATSEPVQLARGDLKQATVRLAVSARRVTSVFNGTLNSTLLHAAEIADASDVTRTSPRVVPQASPNDPFGGTR